MRFFELTTRRQELLNQIKDINNSIQNVVIKLESLLKQRILDAGFYESSWTCNLATNPPYGVKQQMLNTNDQLLSKLSEIKALMGDALPDRVDMGLGGYLYFNRTYPHIFFHTDSSPKEFIKHYRLKVDFAYLLKSKERMDALVKEIIDGIDSPN